MIYMYSLDGLTQKQIAGKTGISVNTVAKYVKHYTRKKSPIRLNESRVWNMEDIEYLIEWYPYETAQSLAYALDKTLFQVKGKIQYLMDKGLMEKKYKRS